MCHSSCLAFGARALTAPMVTNKSVLEVGSRDVNGTLRPHVTSLRPARYVGLDMVEGPGVDEIGLAEELEQRYGSESFDLVLSTEMLEHVLDWHTVVLNLKRVVQRGGHLLITTRSKGFPYHEYPRDCWRYEVADFRHIFSDFTIVALESDPEVPGVFILARKPLDYQELDFHAYQVYGLPQP